MFRKLVLLTSSGEIMKPAVLGPLHTFGLEPRTGDVVLSAVWACELRPPYSAVDGYECFGGTYGLHLHG
jgi:hypothetical protein